MSSLYFFWRFTCMTKPSFSGVVRPVAKRHKSIAKRRAACTTRRFLARLQPRVRPGKSGYVA